MPGFPKLWVATQKWQVGRENVLINMIFCHLF